jgi:hypothetical protein
MRDEDIPAQSSLIAEVILDMLHRIRALEERMIRVRPPKKAAPAGNLRLVSVDDLAEMKRLRAQGESYGDIAKATGFSNACIYQHLKKAGLK